MITLTADGEKRFAEARVDGKITTGSVGLPVNVILSEDFDGLATTVCFEAADSKADVVYTGKRIPVPPQCLTHAGGTLLIGVYAEDDEGNTVIPTIWASAGTISKGAKPSGYDPADPAPSWAAQVQKLAADAVTKAEAAQAEVDTWEVAAGSWTAGTRVTSLDATELSVAGSVVEAMGAPTYVDDPATLADYGVTEAGWYVLARIAAPSGVAVSGATTVAGADGSVVTEGADHVDVAVLFGVASVAKAVAVAWDAEHLDAFTFRATDLAVRNLDYRTTFYVYDLAPYATFEFSRSTDQRFVGTEYWVRDAETDLGYSRASVRAYDVVPTAYFERTLTYALTEDVVFAEGKAYYVLVGGEYAEAEVTPGTAVAAGTYYECTETYAPTEDATFDAAKTYYTRSGLGTAAKPYSYAEAEVTAGEDVPTIFFLHSYALTTDETFMEGTVYYERTGTGTEADPYVYTAATVTTGEPVTPSTYYVDVWEVTSDGEFVGTVYYVESGEDGHEQAAVQAGAPASYYTREVEHPQATEATFVGTEYWVVDGETDLGYSRAAVLGGSPVPASPAYYTHAYKLLTAAGKFAANTRYYKLVDGAYVLQEVTVGGSYAKNVYYVDQWTEVTEASTFVGTAYCLETGGVWQQVAVVAGETIPAVYYTLEHSYALTEDATFQDGTTYYVESEGEYTVAEVTTGEAVAEGTYYVRTDHYEPAGLVSQEGVTYYTRSGDTYTEAEVTPGTVLPRTAYAHHVVSWPQATGEAFEQGVTYYVYDKPASYYAYDGCAWCYDGGMYSVADVGAGDPIPAWFVHSQLTVEGMVRNVTYQLAQPVDCPTVFVLPEVEDETHGCWYEMRFRHHGSFSSTLQVPDGVKVATEHTQSETKGINMVDLHYTSVAGVKCWRFMNTHSTIPT